MESKKDLAAREINSPNDADAFIMAYSPELPDKLAGLLALALKQ